MQGSIEIANRQINRFDKLSCYIKSNKKQIIYALVSTFVFGLIAHAYGIYNNTLSFDSLVSFSYGSVENTHKVALGRWFVPIYRSIFNTGIIEPWAQFVLACLWISVSVFLLLKLFELKNKINYVIISSLLVTNITFTAQTATYIFELDANMFCMMLAVIAVYIWAKYRSILTSVISGILLIICLGIYQSYISVALTLVIMFCMIAFLNCQKVKDIVLQGVRFIAIVAGAALMYLATTFIMLKLYHTQYMTNTYNAFDADRFLNSFARNIFGVYRNCIGNIIVPTSFNSSKVIVVGTLLVLIASFVSFLIFLKNKKVPISNLVWFFLLIILMPFGMNVTYIISGGMVHELMQYAFWLFWVFIIILFEKVLIPVSNKSVFVLYVISLAAIVFLIWNNVLVANGYYVEKKLQEDATLAQMTNIVEDISEYDSFDLESTEIVLIGKSTSYNQSEMFSSLNGITGFESTISYDATKNAYFNYILNYPAKIANSETIARISEEQEVKNMPSYPKKGYIKMINDYLVVKLSDA